MKKILITLVNFALINKAFSQNVEITHPMLYESFKQKIELVFSTFIKDTKPNDKVFRIDFWKNTDNDSFQNLNDTDYFIIDPITSLTEVCYRLPTTYLIEEDIILLIYTGLEDKIVPNSGYLKSLFSLLKGKIKYENVIVNSFENYNFTVIVSQPHSISSDDFPTLHTYLVNSGKVVKKKLSLNFHYGILPYKHDRKIIK